MVELVDSYFPEWANLYHSLPFNIQRLDMIRYMILYCHGGVYVDLDIECFKSIDPLVENKSFFWEWNLLSIGSVLMDQSREW